ncbi:MAG: DUF4234 domain-containing protein [Clostridia bacterium]|nr:DUF4234 domain-containing protein [Clostridia bacterium]
MQYQKRSPAAILLLSIITCGIYGWYVIYRISKEVREFRGDASIDPGIELLLCILTGGLYSLYWYYKFSKLIFEMQTRCGTPAPADNAILLVILTCVKLGLVSLMLLQSELNRVWDTVDPGVYPN